MSKFNQKAKTISSSLSDRADATTNLAGGLAFRTGPEMELYLSACTGLFEDKSYGNTKTIQHQRLKELVSQCDREFVLKLAAFVRNEMNLRSMPIALLGEVAKLPNPKGDSLVRKFTPAILRRADEPAELLSYLWGGSNRTEGKGNKIPMAVRRGICDALENFDEYQLQKWNKSSAGVKLRDVIRVLRPKPSSEERSDLYRRANTGDLATPETWETYISANGSTGETWDSIAPSMGVMALIRNLRNFEQKGAAKALQIAVDKIRDPETVRNSKQLPFRWYTAWCQVTNSLTKDALLEALELSVVHLPKWRGPTAIFVDLSGSMSTKLSDKSIVSYNDVASLMGAMACFLTRDDYCVGAFGQSYKTVSLSRRDSIMTNMQKIQKTNVGHSTEAWKCIQHLIDNKIVMDRVVVLSDMQCYNNTWGSSHSLASLWVDYKRNVAPNATLYSIDLSGGDTTQFPTDENSVVQVSGWSDKIFQFIESVENSGSAVDVINAIPVPQDKNLKTWEKSMRHNLYEKTPGKTQGTPVVGSAEPINP